MSREHIAKVLKNLRKSKGFTADQVGAFIGKSGKTVNAWENNHGQPDAEILIQLCDLYGVEDILNEFRDTPKSKTPPPLTAEELKLINQYRNLNSTGQRMLIEHAAMMTASGLYQKEPSKTVFIAARNGKIPDELPENPDELLDAPDTI